MDERNIEKSVREGEQLGRLLTEQKSPEQQLKEVNDWIAGDEKRQDIWNEVSEGSFIADRHRFYNSIDTEEEFRSFSHKRRKKSVLRILQYGIPAAAAIIISLFVWQGITSKEPVSSENTFVAEAEILPGSSKAILVLEDNREVNLSDQKQQIQNIAQAENDELCYTNTIPSASQDKVPHHRLITPVGGEYRLTLSDGTKVWINAESELSYPVTFSGNVREVRLIGEAYFEVAKNTEKPFRVKTGNFDVVVTGTAFNISAYKEENTQSITLVNGGVDVNAGEKLLSRLMPGKQLNYNRSSGSYNIEDADIESVTAWKNGLFLFRNEPLESIARKLGRWYNVEFILLPGLSDKYYSGLIERDERIDATLNILRLTNEIEFKIKGHQIEIVPVQ